MLKAKLCYSVRAFDLNICNVLFLSKKGIKISHKIAFDVSNFKFLIQSQVYVQCKPLTALSSLQYDLKTIAIHRR